MIYPVLAYKENGDLRLYGLPEEKNLTHTSRELLKVGILNGAFIIDSEGNEYKLKNVREVGWANAFWGISLIYKGRQIIVDFDADFISQKSLEEVKVFVLERLKQMKRDALSNEIHESVKNAKSIEQIIRCFV